MTTQRTTPALDLREVVARAIAQRMLGLGWQVLNDATRDGYRRSADAALAALGLDDLDAAVLRASVAIHEQRFSSNPMDYGRAALEAALTP